MRQITNKQMAVLEFLRDFIGGKGFPPTRREIADHFKFGSENAAESHLKSLEAKGAIIVTRGVSRGIKLICTANTGKEGK